MSPNKPNKKFLYEKYFSKKLLAVVRFARFPFVLQMARKVRISAEMYLFVLLGEKKIGGKYFAKYSLINCLQNGF